MRKQKVLISGGGVPGLVLAHALAHLPLDITLTEPSPPLAANDGPDGRTVAIMARHVAWLDAMGLWQAVAPLCGRLATMRVIDQSIPGRGSARPHDFNASIIGQSEFAWNVPLRGLRRHLWVSLPSSVYITAEKPDEPFDLIVAADGRQSPTRERAGIKASHYDTGQSALTMVVRRAKPHAHISTEFQRMDGPLTFVPLPDPLLCSVVFVGRAEDQKSLLAAGPDALKDAIRTIAGEDVEIISGIELYPLAFLQADDLWKDNVVLTAEAAHVLHPLGAQGMNLSLQDMKILGDLVEKAVQNGLSISDPHAVMTAYHTARHADHLIRTRAVRTSLDFLRLGTVTGGVRRRFLGLLDHFPALEKTILKIAQ